MEVWLLTYIFWNDLFHESVTCFYPRCSSSCVILGRAFLVFAFVLWKPASQVVTVQLLCFCTWLGHPCAGVWVSLVCYLGILSFKHYILPKPFYLTPIFPCRSADCRLPRVLELCVIRRSWLVEFQGCPHCLWTQVFNKRCPSLFPHLTS